MEPVLIPPRSPSPRLIALTRGLLLHAIVTPADLQDRAVARDMLTRLRLTLKIVSRPGSSHRCDACGAEDGGVVDAFGGGRAAVAAAASACRLGR